MTKKDVLFGNLGEDSFKRRTNVNYRKRVSFRTPRRKVYIKGSHKLGKYTEQHQVSMSSQYWHDILASRAWKSLPQFESNCDNIDNGRSRITFKASSAKSVECDDIEDAGNELPPPKRFDRKQCLQATAENSNSIADPSTFTMVVSASRPHTILSVTDELPRFLGYSPQQICGRSLGVLQGPNTNASQLHAALKSAAISHSSTSLAVKLYSSQGAELDLVLACAAQADSTLGVHVQAAAAAEAVVAQRLGAAEDKRGLRRQYRKRYCFRQGLAIQQALERRAAGLGRTPMAC